MPYRTNLPYQEDRRKYGKWSARKIRRDVKEAARETGFDLRRASGDEIRSFMHEQKLGIDCSGLVYQLYDSALKKLGYRGMRSIGFGKASSVNVQTLTTDKYSRLIEDKIVNFRPGDMIRFTGKQPGEWHVMMILAVSETELLYGHSSAHNNPDGVANYRIRVLDKDKSIKEQDWNDLTNEGINRKSEYIPERGDGIYRLKVIEYGDA